MSKITIRDIRGLSQIQLALLLAVVVVVGVVAWKVTSNRSTLATGINKATQATCMAEVNDKVYCKFAGTFANITNYKASLSVTDETGASSGIDLAYNGSNSSMAVKVNGQEQASVVVYNGFTYSKDYTDGKWFKYAASNTTKPEGVDLKKEFLKK